MPPSKEWRIKDEVKTLFAILFKGVKGSTQAERLESFYSNQAHYYDHFRKRLLAGREQLLNNVMQRLRKHERWIDLASGTGIALEFAGENAARFKEIHLVDLSQSLLNQAAERVGRLGLKNVKLHRLDLCTQELPLRDASLVTCVYGLTMIPNWYRVLRNIENLLSPDGMVAIADFYVSRKYPAPSKTRHGWGTRSLLPLWFAADDVFLSPDHLPVVEELFSQCWSADGFHRLPYLPFMRAPYYQFVGTKHIDTYCNFSMG